MAQWVGRRPAKQKVTHLGRMPELQVHSLAGVPTRRQLIDISLSHQCFSPLSFSLPSPLSKNKWIKSSTKKRKRESLKFRASPQRSPREHVLLAPPSSGACGYYRRGHRSHRTPTRVPVPSQSIPLSFREIKPALSPHAHRPTHIFQLAPGNGEAPRT